MTKQQAMSLQARRAGPVVATGIALATAGILVAVPAIVPPLATRDAQVAADVQSALSTAQVNLAALSDALLAFQDGGPVGALLAVLNPDVQVAFQDGGPLGAVLFGLAATLPADGPLAAALTTFQDGGPLGAVLNAAAATLPADGPLAAALTTFQDGGPLGAVLNAAAATLPADGPLAAALTTFQDGGPLNAVLAAIAAVLQSSAAAGGATTLAAQGEASTPITNVGGLFGRNAEANAGRSFVNLFTRSQPDAGGQSDPTIEANAEAPKPLRAALRERPQSALPKPFQAVVPKAPAAEVPEAPVIEVANKAPVIKVPEKTDEGTKGSGEGNGLVRNSLQFKPNTILPVGSESGAGAGGWKPFQGIKNAIGKLTGGGGSLNGSANATDGGAESGDTG